MSINRRLFIKRSLQVAGAAALSQVPLSASAYNDHPEWTKLMILHTNDWHSRVEPFPMDGGKYQGFGGAARRAAMIRDIRANEEHLHLLDSGDVFQGTPYFNYFHGELEFKLMSYMGYDAATLGNHDFDAGLEGLQKVLPLAKFPFLTANYDFSETILKDAFKPYKIFKKGPLRIGVFGINIELKGLVSEASCGKTKYLDPIEKANEIATHLKLDKQCDFIICLSHLGYKYDNNKVSDLVLAQNTRYIDLILGGHTHTFLDVPDIVRNLEGRDVMINQVGWAGINLGKLEFYFDKKRKLKDVKAHTVIISKNTIG